MRKWKLETGNSELEINYESFNYLPAAGTANYELKANSRMLKDRNFEYRSTNDDIRTENTYNLITQ